MKMDNGYEDARWVLARVEAKRYGDLKTRISALEEQAKAMKDSLLAVMETCPVNEKGHQELPGVPDYTVKAYGRTQFFGSAEKAREILAPEQFAYIFKESASTVLDVRMTKAAKARLVSGPKSSTVGRFEDKAEADAFAAGLRAGLEMSETTSISEVFVAQDAVDGRWNVVAVGG